MDKLLKQYNMCNMLINYYETFIRHIDLFNNSGDEWTKAENRLRELLEMQKGIVEEIEKSPEFQELLNTKGNRGLN